MSLALPRSWTHLSPALANLLRRGGARRPDLLDGDRGDEVAERRRLFRRRPRGDGTGDAGAGAVAGAHGVDGARDRVTGDQPRLEVAVRIRHPDAAFPVR